MADFDFQKLLCKILKNAGLKPDRIVVDVLIKKGDFLEGIIIGTNVQGQKYYHNEEQARAELKPGQSLYKVDVYRLE